MLLYCYTTVVFTQSRCDGNIMKVSGENAAAADAAVAAASLLSK